jgi:hypothetical protein
MIIYAYLRRLALLPPLAWSNVQRMAHLVSSHFLHQFARRVGAALLAAFVFLIPRPAIAGPTPAAVASFNSYTGTVEARLEQQHRSAARFIAPQDMGRLHNGELIIEKLAPASPAGFPGAMLHHWRGTAFTPGAKAADFERLMRNFGEYPQYYAPQVVRARILSQQGDHYQVMMRVRQHHVITVVMDTAYDVTFARLDAQYGYSVSRSTRISEIDSPGTAHERALDPGEDHGFLWRLNSYWSYEERDGGLYMQIESISLTRAIPTGLGWAIGPFVESVPRESLEFTLRSTRDALKK